MAKGDRSVPGGSMAVAPAAIAVVNGDSDKLKKF